MSEAASFGDWLKAAREEEGLSQGALAAAIGVKQPVVSRIENGLRATITRDEAAAIAAALNRSIEEVEAAAGIGRSHRLLAAILEGDAPEIVREPDPDWDAWVGHYEGLTPAGRQYLIHTAEYIRDLERRSAIGGTGEPRRARRESRPEEDVEEPEEKPAR